MERLTESRASKPDERVVVASRKLYGTVDPDDRTGLTATHQAFAYDSAPDRLVRLSRVVASGDDRVTDDFAVEVGERRQRVGHAPNVIRVA